MDEFFEDWEAEAAAGPGNEFLKVDFAYGADGVELVVWLVWSRSCAGLVEIDAYIGGTGIVLREIASQARWVELVMWKEISVFALAYHSAITVSEGAQQSTR